MKLEVILHRSHIFMKVLYRKHNLEKLDTPLSKKDNSCLCPSKLWRVSPSQTHERILKVIMAL